MVKKGSLFSAIKRVFTPHSKEKLGNQEQERKSGKEKKKKGFGRRETNSFLPIFREPSSIEKILGEAERDHNLVFRPPTPDRSHPFAASPLRPASPRVPTPRPTSPRASSPRAASPKPRSPRSLSPKPPPRADLPRSLSPKPSDRSKPSSASANAPPPLRSASPRVQSQKITTPPNVPSQKIIIPPTVPSQKIIIPPNVPSQKITTPPNVPSPRSTSPRVASLQTVSPKPPSPRADPPILDTPRPSSPKPHSPRATPLRPEQPRLDASRHTTPKPPSPRAEPPSLDAPRLTTPNHPSPRAEPPSLDAPRLTTPNHPSPRADPPRLDAPRPTTPKLPSPREISPMAAQRREIVHRPEPTLQVQHASATKIQGAFRGYMARKSFRALKGLVRLQGVVRGYSVKRQTVNAIKYMQQVVRVQSQIQSRRIKMLENQAQVEKDVARLAASEAGSDNWDDSVLTKEERDARSQKKIDAIIKRERSMAYAYSYKLWKNNPRSALDNRWWNWADRQNPLASPVPSHSQPLRDFRLTPTRLCPSPLSQSSNQHHIRLDNHFGTSTPRSSRSTFPTPSRPAHTGTSRYSRGRLRGQDSPFKDDDSLTSCPPFPSYMAPTVSAKAKVRPNSNPKDRVMGTTPVSEKRRMSYPPAQQGLDMFRWKKGSLLMSNSSSHRGPGSPGGVVLEKHKTLKSVGNLSIDSTVSMPASVGRKAFNRFV